MTTETVWISPMSQKSTYFPVGNNSLTTQNVIYTSHVPLDLSIEDLACNMINVKATCKGSLQVVTIPDGADIYIHEESQGDYVLRSVKTGTISNPTIINDIECTGPTRSNKFKLTLLGYVDVEGILDITDGTVYQLYIIMEMSTVTELGGGGFLIPALAIGGLILLLSGGEKKKLKKEYYDKYKEIYE